MKMDLRRVILFVDDLKAMTDFYENKLGLKILSREEGFVDFDAGGIKLALHEGVSNPGRTKICFYAADVSKARQELIDNGVRMGIAVADGGEHFPIVPETEIQVPHTGCEAIFEDFQGKGERVEPLLTGVRQGAGRTTGEGEIFRPTTEKRQEGLERPTVSHD